MHPSSNPHGQRDKELPITVFMHETNTKSLKALESYYSYSYRCIFIRAQLIKSPREPPACKLPATSDQDPIQRTLSSPSVACRQASSCIPVLLFAEVGEGH